MKERPCPEEPRVLRAWREGTPGEALREHVSGCEWCRGAVEAWEFMQSLAADVPEPDHRLPEAGRIWWRAQLVRRWETERRVSRQLDRVYPFQAGAIAATVVLGTFLSWPVAERWLAQSELGEATRLAAALVPAGMVTSLIGGSVVLAVLMVLMARDMMTE